MSQTIQAEIQTDGTIRPLEPLKRTAGGRVLITIQDDLPPIPETALLSEQSLAADWNRPEEDEAWSHLQPERSS
jgi:hypothetical protein